MDSRRITAPVQELFHIDEIMENEEEQNEDH